MRFSEQYGYVRPREAIQKESLDEDTRNRLANKVSKRLFNEEIWTEFWTQYLKKPASDLKPHRDDDVISRRSCREDCAQKSVQILLDSDFFLVMDTLQFLAKNPIYASHIENVFSEEGVGWKLVGRQFIPIVEEEQVMSIEAVLDHVKVSDAAKKHISNALKNLRPGEGLSYSGSIREAIHAVESECKALSGKTHGTLSDGLKEIVKIRGVDRKLNPAFEQALQKLYAYTNSEDGIRHAGIDSSEKTSQADAIFMVVTCSAFISWLRAQ